MVMYVNFLRNTSAMLKDENLLIEWMQTIANPPRSRFHHQTAVVSESKCKPETMCQNKRVQMYACS